MPTPLRAGCALVTPKLSVSAKLVQHHRTSIELVQSPSMGQNSGRLLGLLKAQDFVRFVERDFDFYTGWYIRLNDASSSLTSKHEAIYCNGLANFTMQYPLMMAPILPTDSEEIVWQKADLVATFVDILIARRMWHGRSIDYNTMQYAMFLVLREIRGRSPREIVGLLRERIEQDTGDFQTNTKFGLWGSNRKTVRRFLARLTAWLDRRIGLGENLSSYLISSGAQGYDIEHIVAHDYERHRGEFQTEDEFEEYRNRLGALLLLPRSFNRSYGDLSFEKKRSHYLQQHSLAQTLHEQAYDRNPGLKRVILDAGIPFRAHTEFRKADIEARQDVYVRLADAVWSLERLETIAAR